MKNKVAVQMMDQVFSGKDSISVINLWTEFKGAWDSLQIHDEAAAWPFTEFMSDPRLAAIRARLTLSSNDPNKLEDTISPTPCLSTVY